MGIYFAQIFCFYLKMQSKLKKLPKAIGVIHLESLPGSPGAGDFDPAEVLQHAGVRAVNEARALVKCGFDALIIENFGDAPFFKTEVGPETLASMAVISAAVRESVPVPIGINVLRNDARAALAIAAVTGADFIRVNVLSGVTATDQGLIEGCAATLVRERARLRSPGIAIFADVHVKHAKTLSSDDLHLAMEEVTGRGGADSVIITGATTGRSPSDADLKGASDFARKLRIPLYVGSGVQADSLEFLSQFPVGVIVGSTLRKAGKAGAPLDPKRTASFGRALKSWKRKVLRRT